VFSGWRKEQPLQATVFRVGRAQDVQKMPLPLLRKAEKHCFQQDRGPTTVEQSSLLAFAVDFRLPDSPCPREGTGVVGQGGDRWVRWEGIKNHPTGINMAHAHSFQAEET